MRDLWSTEYVGQTAQKCFVESGVGCGDKLWLCRHLGLVLVRRTEKVSCCAGRSCAQVNRYVGVEQSLHRLYA